MSRASAMTCRLEEHASLELSVSTFGECDWGSHVRSVQIHLSVGLSVGPALPHRL